MSEAAPSLNTVGGIVDMVEKLIANNEVSKDKPSQLMLTAINAVMAQIEARSQDAGVLGALTKVRSAYGITAPAKAAKAAKQQPEQVSNERPA